MERLTIIAQEIRKLAAREGLNLEKELNYWCWEIDCRAAQATGQPLHPKPECPICGCAFVSVDGEDCQNCGQLDKCSQCGKVWPEDRFYGESTCCSEECADKDAAQWERIKAEWPPPPPTADGLSRIIHDLFVPVQPEAR